MPSFRELLAATKSQIREIDTAAADEQRRRPGAVVLDVREPDEYEQGAIPGAVHIPRGTMESSVENRIPDKSAPVIVHCAGDRADDGQPGDGDHQALQPGPEVTELTRVGEGRELGQQRRLDRLEEEQRDPGDDDAVDEPPGGLGLEVVGQKLHQHRPDVHQRERGQ